MSMFTSSKKLFFINGPTRYRCRQLTTLGEALYRQAEYYIQKHKEITDEREAERQWEQYKSKSGKDIIKKIVSQHRLQNITKYDEGSDFLEKARASTEEAALVHGHGTALVSLANEALKFPSSKLKFKHVKGMKTIIDVSCLEELQPIQVAIKLYDLACDKGIKDAWFNKGQIFWNGYESDTKGEKFSIEPNVDKAVVCFQKAVELGDDDARFFLGVKFINEIGTGIEKRKNGLELIRAAAENNHTGAIYYLSLLYRNGNQELGLEANVDLFRWYLDKASDNNDAEALFTRAHCRFHGEDGYAVDLELACIEFENAGFLNKVEGFVSAGAMYHHGHGVEQDKRKAFELYQLAGEGGSIEGWKNVAACYLFGEGVPKCENTARYIIKTILSDRS